MNGKDFILELYKDKRSVFRLSDVAMLFPEAAEKNLSDRMGYYVKTNRLLKLRRNIYAKPDYNPLELANILFTPSYISLEYVLQQAGVIFQYDARYTSVSYLSREVEIDGNTYNYRRIKEEIIVNTKGIARNKGQFNIATPERALLDTLYLNKDFYFDNLHAINSKLIKQIAPIYQSLALEKRVTELFKNDR